MTVKFAAPVLLVGVAVASVGWVGFHRLAATRAARESMAEAAVTRDRLTGQLEGVAFARDQKEALAGDWVQARVSLRELTDAYITLDRMTLVGPNLMNAEAGPRWVAAHSAVVRVHYRTRRLPAGERSAVRDRLLAEFAREFPDRPLRDWP